MKTPRRRLDVAVTERGLVASRERAHAVILAGQVTVDGRVVSKAGTAVAAEARVELVQPDHPYVGRGGLKLAHALDTFGVRVDGREALDIGASTGGFTDVLLQRGASRVVALDVGHGQLDWRIRTDAARHRHRGPERALPLAAGSARAGRSGRHRRVVHLADADPAAGAAGPARRSGRDSAGEAAVRGRARRGREEGRRPRPGRSRRERSSG